jgi:fatty acid desaturase
MATAATAAPAKSAYHYFRSNLLTPQRIRELSALRPARALRDIVFCWLVIVATWTVIAYRPVWWTILPGLVVIGTRYYALFVIGHDGMHRRVAQKTATNDLICDVLIFGPIGAIIRLNNHNHLQHHYWLATNRDPDRLKHCCFNKATLASLIGFLTGVTVVFVAARHVFFPKKGDGSTRIGYTLRDFVILAGWTILLCGGLTWRIGFWAYPVLWLLPVFVFMYLADNFRSFAEHSHPEADSLADTHRLVTYRSNPLECMFVAPMNMNLHTVHHLWPSIPYYNLPIADKEIRQMPASAALEWRGSYFAYLWRYTNTLPLAECQPTNQAALIP